MSRAAVAEGLGQAAATLCGWIGRRLRRVCRAARPAAPSADARVSARRVAMTLRCRDSAPIPKVPRAGSVIERAGRAVQVMHEGTLRFAMMHDVGLSTGDVVHLDDDRRAIRRPSSLMARAPTAVRT